MTQTQIVILIAIIVVLAIVLGLVIATARSVRKNRRIAEQTRRTNEQIAAARKRAENRTSTRAGASGASRPQGTPSLADQAAAEHSGAAGAAATGVPSRTAGSAAASQPSQKAASKAASTESAKTPPAAMLPESGASRAVRLRARLASGHSRLGRALFGILTRDHLSEQDWEDLEDTLLLADVGAEASERLVEALKKDARITGERDPKAVRQALRARLLDLVEDGHEDRSLVALRPGADKKKPQVIIMVGVNGSGKTTTVGKLGRLLKAEGKSVMFAAADTFRAAAADQLATWAGTSGIPLVRADHDGADPASVAYDAAQKAVEQGTDVLLIDTAGRLQNKQNLMDELGKIRRVVEKTVPVDEVLLVLDATVGRNGVEQARVFSQAIGVTGVVLTKLDGSAKGGVVISVQDELGVPVKLVGLGEGPDDLAVFDPGSFVDGLVPADPGSDSRMAGNGDGQTADARRGE